ncbi:hypothetical protein Tco_0161536 [Tanacetum coccineum]
MRSLGLSSCHDDESWVELLPILYHLPLLHTLPHQTRCTTTHAHISSYFIPTIVVTPLSVIERIDPRYEVGESSAAAAARPTGGLRADYGFVATMDREIRRDLERYVGYGITDSWDEIVDTL